jgi:hypothetical protein
MNTEEDGNVIEKQSRIKTVIGWIFLIPLAYVLFASVDFAFYCAIYFASRIFLHQEAAFVLATALVISAIAGVLSTIIALIDPIKIKLKNRWLSMRIRDTIYFAIDFAIILAVQYVLYYIGFQHDTPPSIPLAVLITSAGSLITTALKLIVGGVFAGIGQMLWRMISSRATQSESKDESE